MTTKEFVIQKLAEECAEVIQECTKSNSYGLDHVVPGHGGVTNQELLIRELNDVFGTLHFLVGMGLIPENWANQNMVKQKILKVQGSLEYARSLKIVTD